MEEMTSGLDPDELMDLDEAEGSDLDEDEEDVIDDPIPSPFQLPSSGPGSTATSTASSPPNIEEPPPPFNFSGKPLHIKRGRGRPRREGGKPLPRRSSAGGGRQRRVRASWNTRGIPKRVKSFDRDFEFSSLMSSPGDDGSLLDGELGFTLHDKDKMFPAPEEMPFFPEQWPGKVCAFCNLGERSQLGQGEMMRLTCPEGFTPQRIVIEQPEVQNVEQLPEREIGDKSPRGPVTCRRQKSFNKCRHPSMTSEYVDELTIIGYVEEPDVQLLFENTGHFYVHRNCASWSHGVSKIDNAMVNVGPTVLHSSSKKCAHCNHYGASLLCNMEGCNKVYHYPCATASGAFQELSTTTLYCSQHLSQVTLMCISSVCYTCKSLGDVANLMYCSSCGEHYHGTCVGLAQLPGVRAGWQCRKCRSCQVCRMFGDESKLMACEQCDKVYHSFCQRPIVTSIPKYGWKCRCCRICGDCGSRTPGAGLSSRWHAHYTVCDSCYQQRNKGFSCPYCHRAYRAHAHREMVQCSMCRRFVHGTCDPEADLTTYHQRKEAHPEYEYVCSNCKNITQGRLLSKRNSIEDGDSLSASQESLYDDSEYDFDRYFAEETVKPMGIGRGKPYSATKIAKKRLGLGMPGRPKGVGKGMPGKVGYMKKQRMVEFGRKRGPKAKMRGIFGVPGVGLQRPIADSKTEEEPGVENRLILCSAKDKFVLTQDICVMCGALGANQEGCLISCVQCGQCYHPYCVNIKVTKVLLQKGWRCLDCTVCEGCGQRHDESRLILCDDCDISYHIYCMDPPLDYVPHGNWKCKWCAVCQTCGSTDPGYNSNWMNSFSECGPCASMNNCPSCHDPYTEGELIIQCSKCDRWLHGACDSIKSENDAERCAEDGYVCHLCRPRDLLPPHLSSSISSSSFSYINLKPPTPTKSPDSKSNANYFVDGVCLSEAGHSLIKALSAHQQYTRKRKSKKLPTLQDKEAGIMATIESVIAGNSTGDHNLDDSKLELIDVKDEQRETYMEGMEWTKENGPPPEGFTIITMESGNVLRRKRQRNLQKIGIGGFIVRNRGIRSNDNDEIDVLPGQSCTPLDPPPPGVLGEVEKPRRKQVRRKPKSKLSEMFPSYIQEAFFGKELMDTNKIDSSSCSDEEGSKRDKEKTIQLSQDELKAVAAVTAKADKRPDFKSEEKSNSKMDITPKEEDESDSEAFKDVLALPGDLLDNDLVNTIMNGDDDELTKNTDTLEGLADTLGSSSNSKDTKDELSDILGSHFNIDAIPNINSKDVEDLFKGVLTDESQESQESSVFPMNSNTVFNNSQAQPSIPHMTNAAAARPTNLPGTTNNLNSPGFPPQSPYHSEYSNSPQFSPAFSEPPSPWVNLNDPNDIDNASSVPSTYNQRTSDKMKADECLGSGATISAVLYANLNHPEWKTEYKSWSDRNKQIIKKWRTLTTEQKAPYLQQAKDNRSALRMKKQQQISKEGASSPTVPKTATTPVASAPPTQVPAAAPVTEVCTPHTRPSPSLTNASTSSVSVSPCTTPRPASVPSSPPVQQQFTVHGPVLGPGDHCGPAPNVTVNPLYQPPSEKTPTPLYQAPAKSPTPPPRPSAPPPAADQQIRVLTPSEIMRTLPSLCQENYEPQPLDQEKIAQQQKSAREAEQERQWKALQALRQQQAQQQQNVIQEQRVQDLGIPAIARVQRQMTDMGGPMIGDQNVLQVTTSQELNPASSSPSSRPFIGIKSPPFTHSPMGPRPTTPSQPASPSPSIDFPNNNEAFVQQPATPKPLLLSSQPTSNVQGFQPRVAPDPYAQQPGTPRPGFQATPRPQLQAFGQTVRTEGQEINRQLRDLLQRQQFKKLDEQLLPGKGQQRVWPPQEGVSQEAENPTGGQVPGDATFRHPLPPGIVRPRVQTGIVRQMSVPGLRMSGDPRMQGLDPRMRLMLQQQQRGVAPGLHQFQQSQLARFQTPVRPGVEQFDQMLQRPQLNFQPRQGEQVNPRMSVPTPALAVQRPVAPGNQPVTSQPNTVASNENNEQEIPDNVTAELEKLEELQSVQDILGGLGDDDDDILAEMGADFNILEYADPELDALAGGEKTNILDTLDLVEAESAKEEKKEVKVPGMVPKPPASVATTKDTTPQQNVVIKQETTNPPNVVVSSATNIPENVRPPPLTATQPQQQAQPQPQQQQPQVHQPQQMAPQNQISAQHIYQQMLAQVQQAAAMGRPIAPGTKLVASDNIVGIVTQNNGVSISLPNNYQQRIIQLQNQKQLQMRLGLTQTPRLLNANAAPNQVIHGNPVGLGAPPRLNVAAPPPPPPPPYPGPPPPYPGSTSANQMGLRMGPSPMGHLRLPLGLMPSVRHPIMPLPQRRPLLLEEQPLLLEDLLEQEKREQEKQLQAQPSGNQPTQQESSNPPSSGSLLSDQDFERLKADVLGGGGGGPQINIGNANNSSNSQAMSTQGLLPVGNITTTASRQNFQARSTPPTTTTATMPNAQWQQNAARQVSAQPQPQADITPRVPTYNANLLPAPPLPPEHIVTEQDKQSHLLYEQWLNHQNEALKAQMAFYLTEVQKLRKSRKSLNSKQRQLKKSGNQLAEPDASELQRIQAEQSIIQKHLETSRKQSRQHEMLMQEYRNKKQQRPGPGQSPLLMAQTQSPLRAPQSSPIHPNSSPMMSPSASPMMQHNSPMHSPAPVVSHSPGPGSMSSVMQSPGGQNPSMSPMQPSPRIGTPLSQNEGSPGPAPSPSQIILPPPMSRMTSPQHRRVVTSPVGYSNDLRPTLGQQVRFSRPTIDAAALQQRARLQAASPSFQQKPGTPSPLNSPPPQQMVLSQQQILQRHLQQQMLLQQQQQQQQQQNQQQQEGGQENVIQQIQTPRTLQLIQQRQLIMRQQMAAQAAQQNQQAPAQPPPLTPHQHQLMVQQQKQLAIAQQQQLQMQSQANRIQQQQQQQQQQQAERPPQSPMLNQAQQIMSPHSIHSQPASPMPPRSPMVSGFNQPNSPIARSPSVHSMGQPPNSPMMHPQQYPPTSSPMPRSPMVQSPMSIRRHPGSSPANPDRPLSIENPGTPRSVYAQSIPSPVVSENDQSGGGNPHNPANAVPIPPGFVYTKLGLFGGSPMWGLGRGAKRPPNLTSEKDDKPELETIKKEPHLTKVSILKKQKAPFKTNLHTVGLSRVNSLVSTDYNEVEDGSSTPPVTPPPSTSRLVQKSFGKKLPDSEVVVVESESKHIRVEEIMDYDDDNDTNVVSTEVSLSSTAQNDGDDITVIQTFSQNDLGDVITSPMESDQIDSDQIDTDFLLFPVISENPHEEDEEEYNIGDKNMHIVNVAIQSPTTSEEEMILLGKTEKVTSDGLTPYIVQGLSNHLLSVTDTPDSPEQEEMNVDPPESPEEEISPSNFSMSPHQQIVIINSNVKSPEEQISTKEDFEKLIDEGSRKEKINSKLSETKLINEMHKYAATSNPSTSVFTFPSKTITTSNFIPSAIIASGSRGQNVVNLTQAGQKISLVPIVPARPTTPRKVNDVIIGQNQKLTSTYANIFLPSRSNIITVPKIVTSVSSALTIVSGGTTAQIASILPSRFTVPVISASAVSKLPNVKVIDKPSTLATSLATHAQETLPKKIFEDDSVSPDSSNCEDDSKSKQDSSPDIKFEDSLSEVKKPQEKTQTQNNRINIQPIIVTTTENGITQSHIIKTIVKDDGPKINEQQQKNDNRQKDANEVKENSKVGQKVDNVHLSNLLTQEKIQRVSSPMTTKPSTLVIHTTPELKMTAQIIQDMQPVQIASRNETISSYMTTQTIDGDGVSEDLDNKSVVISIPSPTPSQEQMLDNIAMQALENRRRDGKGISGEFESFEDVLDMIENIQADPPLLDEKMEVDQVEVKQERPPSTGKKVEPKPNKIDTPVTVTTTSKGNTTMPQLSPLSQPTELTTNMANVSQQLRTLLSSLHTTTVTTSSNVETVVKSVTHKEKVVPQVSAASTSSIVTSRVSQPIVQQILNPSAVISSGTVIVPNYKQKTLITTSGKILQSQTLVNASANSINTLNNVIATTATGVRTIGGIQLMPDHPKLPPVTTVAVNATSSAFINFSKQSVITSSVPTTASNTQQNQQQSQTQQQHQQAQQQVKKPSLTLNAMLQSHPAATMPQTSPSTITTASILGSPISMAKSNFNASLVQAQPRVVTPIVTSSNQVQSSSGNTLLSAIITSTQNAIPRPAVSTTNFLHEHLTKASVIRTKSIEEASSSTEVKKIKEESKNDNEKANDSNLITTASLLKQELPSGGCKYSSIQTPSGREDSQNVLLKQLLQNTACAGSTSQLSNTPSTSAPTQTAPSLPIVPNLEAQLARPVPPTPTSLLPPILQNDNSQQQSQQQLKQIVTRSPIVNRETSFVSKPVQQPMVVTTSTPTTMPQQPQQQLHIDIKRCLPPSRTPSRDDLLSPPTPRSSCSQDSSLQTPPLLNTIKKEVLTAQQSPLLTPQEVKKELVDESSQHSEVSDYSRPDTLLKEEMVDCLDSSTERMTQDPKEELKKMKRRAYQQKRRQNQMNLNKDTGGQPKKRPRKSSKLDEDYDSYIEGVIGQMRSLPPLIVSEPVLSKNYNTMPPFGSGDLLKVGCKDFDPRYGDLIGSYGNAVLPGFTDYYNTKPYGDLDPLPEKPPASTQRGFYDQEFPLIKFDIDDDKKFNLFSREDTPDSIISSSSPECVQFDFDESCRFTGLKLISDDEDDDDDTPKPRSLSPTVPIIVPIPIKLKPSAGFLKDLTDDKENINRDCIPVKTKFGPAPSTPSKDTANVTVTLTLTSSAAEDIIGVLRDLANILHIPAPTSYQIVERTSTPPSQKLGLYRTKGKDGKEGAPIDIQSILNGEAKFCKHCDVVILNNMIRKKVSELPFFSKDSDFLDDGDELYFCTTACYMQFALMHRSPSVSEDKAAATIDHLCQKEKTDTQKKQLIESQKQKEEIEIPTPIERMEVDYELKTDIKQEDLKDDASKDSVNSNETIVPSKSWKGIRYKRWAPGALQPSAKYKKQTDKEIMELLYKLSITVTPSKIPEDTRKCMFCHGVGDGVGDGPGRLLNFDVDKWVHLNCGLWSDGVYETVNGALMNLETALQQSLSSTCIHCNNLGATIKCFKTRCSNIYHLSCAVKDGCVFYKNKSTFCTSHIPKGEKDNELTTLSVNRRVYVNRDENRQVAAVMHHSDTNNLLRVGSLIFLSVGQLLPHQLQNFHTANCIYPIGYKIIRFYWSMRRVNKRCRYVCSIHEVSGRPEFRIVVQEPSEEDIEFKDLSPKAVWNKVLEPLAALRRENQCVQIFPKFVTGEDLFGLTEPAIVRVLESLPGIETLTDYKFKYGRNPLLELPLAINPSGAARSEPRLRNQLHWKRVHTQRTGSSARPVFVPAASLGTGEAACPYSKQFVHSKSQQYRKMKQEWRNNVYLARSKIQGLGLYAARDLERHTMVIEYIGEIIRTEVAETREKKYEARNRGIYMFRLDEERVVDATLSGGLARYINHSCNPNCVAEIVEVDRDLRIIIFAKRRIQRGEELAYDYKFDIEDDQHKISCMCGAPNCRKWMN